MTNKIEMPRQIGLLGAGYIADWHAAALKTVPGVRLAAICDRDDARARVRVAVRRDRHL